jgi:hypothetical protein
MPGLRELIAGGVLALAVGATSPAAAEMTSTYSSIAPDDCRQVFSDEESGSVAFSCPGVAGIDIWVGEGDLRTFFGFGETPRKQCSASQTFGPFNTVGGKLEWRLRDGRPIAAIVRYRLDDGAGNRQNFLTVMALKDGQACHMAYVDGAMSGHNVTAREIADSRAEAFDCAKDMPFMVTERDVKIEHLVSGIPCGPEAAMGFKE